MRPGVRNKRDKRKRPKAEAIAIEPSSGNVFADLGLPHPEELLAKAQLVQRIIDIITERKLTQAQAAAILGINQPKVSALMRGTLDGFSSDRLFRFLNVLGQNVEIVIRPTKEASEQASTRVASA
jgi:predicted XRE-type DNA-binding protein